MKKRFSYLDLFIITLLSQIMIDIFPQISLKHHLPKSKWECTMRDVRPKHMNCTQYELKDEYRK